MCGLVGVVVVSGGGKDLVGSVLRASVVLGGEQRFWSDTSRTVTEVAEERFRFA
jgi:hypothetical protein